MTVITDVSSFIGWDWMGCWVIVGLGLRLGQLLNNPAASARLGPSNSLSLMCPKHANSVENRVDCLAWADLRGAGGFEPHTSPRSMDA